MAITAFCYDCESSVRIRVPTASQRDCLPLVDSTYLLKINLSLWKNFNSISPSLYRGLHNICLLIYHWQPTEVCRTCWERCMVYHMNCTSLDVILTHVHKHAHTQAHTHGLTHTHRHTHMHACTHKRACMFWVVSIPLFSQESPSYPLGQSQ